MTPTEIAQDVFENTRVYPIASGEYKEIAPNGDYVFYKQIAATYWLDSDDR